MNMTQRPRTPFFDWSVHPMPNGEAPVWAGEWGEDDYGPWASLVIPTDHPYRPAIQKMRWIPPGGFWMGSPEDEEGRFDDEGPRHWVTITNGFWLGDTPVTQAMWTTVMRGNPGFFQKGEQGKERRRPVEQVSFDDVQRFLMRLRERIPDTEWRLPTETEWEYGCRAGSGGPLPLVRTRDGNWLPAADRAAIAWFEENSGGETHAVGQLQTNTLGLFEMLGNVWEWCDSLHTPYTSEERIQDPSAPDLTAPAERASRVVRGGSWSGDARYVRAGCRDADHPAGSWSRCGFRLARGQG
jgi:sulfatase modifying factor 1